MRCWLLVAALPLAAPLAAAPVKHAARAPADWSRVVVRTPEGGVRMGSPDAKVKLIEFGARTCPTCALFAQQGVPALSARYVSKGRVSYEFRDFPVHGALDLGPILLGQCVPTARFFPVLAAMMARQQSLVGRAEQIPDAKAAELRNARPNAVAAYLADFYGYTDLVVQQGLPRARAQACLADPKSVDAIVARTDAANKAYRIAGTPSFVVDGRIVPGVFQWTTLEPVLQAAIAAR